MSDDAMRSEAVALYAAGSSLAEIGSLLGVSDSSVGAWLKRAGVVLRRGRPRTKLGETMRYIDVKELDRYYRFKERFLGNEDLVLTGAKIVDDGHVITVVDAAGNRGSMQYDTMAKRDGILAEIERGRRAEQMRHEYLEATPSCERPPSLRNCGPQV